MARIVRLTESDLSRIVRRVINESRLLTEEAINICLPKYANRRYPNYPGYDINTICAKCKTIIDPLVKGGWSHVPRETAKGVPPANQLKKFCSVTKNDLYFVKGQGTSSDGVNWDK